MAAYWIMKNSLHKVKVLFEKIMIFKHLWLFTFWCSRITMAEHLNVVIKNLEILSSLKTNTLKIFKNDPTNHNFKIYRKEYGIDTLKLNKIHQFGQVELVPNASIIDISYINFTKYTLSKQVLVLELTSELMNRYVSLYIISWFKITYIQIKFKSILRNLKQILKKSNISINSGIFTYSVGPLETIVIREYYKVYSNSGELLENVIFDNSKTQL